MTSASTAGGGSVLPLALALDGWLSDLGNRVHAQGAAAVGNRIGTQLSGPSDACFPCSSRCSSDRCSLLLVAVLPSHQFAIYNFTNGNLANSVFILSSFF